MKNFSCPPRKSPTFCFLLPRETWKLEPRVSRVRSAVGRRRVSFSCPSCPSCPSCIRGLFTWNWGTSGRWGPPPWWVTSQSIQSLFFSWSCSHVRWGTPPRRITRVTRLTGVIKSLRQSPPKHTEEEHGCKPLRMQRDFHRHSQYIKN